MKASVSFAGLLPLFLSACLSLEPNSGGRDLPSAPVGDTTVYFTAMCYPDSVDWRLDSLVGKEVPATLVLFRDFEPVLSIETGAVTAVSPDFDLHHLVGGELYTEYADNAHTIIGRNGKELFRYQGREVLCSLIPDTSGVYTLGRNRSGEGFSLRCNGRSLFRSTDGEIVGPLCLDRGMPTFGFRRYVGGEPLEFVFDGRECSQLPRADGELLVDMRLVEGTLYRLNLDVDGRLWFCSNGVSTLVETTPVCAEQESSELCSFGGRIAVAVNGKVQDGHHHIWIWQDGRTVLDDFVEEGYYYSDGDSWGIVDASTDYVSAVGSGEPGLTSPESCYFFRKECAFMENGRFALALTPRFPSEPPLLMRTGFDAGRVEINGALTAVELVVRDPR